MEIGFVGLGRMGGGMARRLLDAGHRVVGYSPSAEDRARFAGFGGTAASSVEELVTLLAERPRAAWAMVPAGEATESVVEAAERLLEAGDILVDGGNSYFRDGQARAARLARRGIDFVDAGTSGGIWGYEVGYCLMVGGPDRAVQRLAPALTDLAPPDGWLQCGPNGAGHFVKMVHNGIEYGLMEAYAEGFEILEHSEFELDQRAIADLWGHGSVIRSWLLELLVTAFAEDEGLRSIADWVDDSGEGRWTVMEAIEEAVPAPVIALSLMMRQRSRQRESYAAKVNAALRKEFGGHAVRALEQEAAKAAEHVAAARTDDGNPVAEALESYAAKAAQQASAADA
jgi:6-phosphogluconate dehydrogenase